MLKYQPKDVKTQSPFPVHSFHTKIVSQHQPQLLKNYKSLTPNFCQKRQIQQLEPQSLPQNKNLGTPTYEETKLNYTKYKLFSQLKIQECPNAKTTKYFKTQILKAPTQTQK